MIIEYFMDKLYFGSGTQDHLSAFRKWDFLKESAKAQESQILIRKINYLGDIKCLRN